ncbi:ABC transporter ATP-binding protein [Microvirga rosea]|uniref:ABC transporter ATP-binding protein n=1 Tax=Microvirga rosea TaxID=2715425 RepID=UPI001D09F707|nr:ABC transporter ATP-binding protein [Microvirga rosea]MCB8821948.1 ABC transporter ATP-binding protein [Microvirga rosea]
MSEQGQVPILSVKNLTVGFTTEVGAVEAVRGVELDLFPSEILAVVGESGSGKSVTALAMLGLLPGDAKITGQIVFQGTDLLRLNHREWSALRGGRIAMIFQDPAAAFDPVFSIGHQIDEVIRLHEPGLGRAARRTRATELLSQVGIENAESRLSRYPHELSGGQLQRVMIAMALAGRPEVLIADEPTTALDVTVQRDILDLLAQLNRFQRMAVLLITHDMGVVADIAQRVVVMRQGRVVETAAVEVLFDSPREDYTRGLLASLPSASPPTQVSSPSSPLLEVRNLTLSYSSGFGRSTEVVRDISFDILAGEFLGLVGESGSGKTTIGRSLLGLIRPSDGAIRLNGQDLHRLSRRDGTCVRSRIGAVFQSPAGSLNPRLTIGQSIAEPILTHLDLSPKRVASRVGQLLEQVGLPSDWRHRVPAELSGGQRQRVALARALALDPILLIADEPTSALDLTVQAGVLQLLCDLQQTHQFACLFISHDLAVVRSLCQRVLVLREGEAVEIGPVEDVLQNPSADYTRRLIASAPTLDPRVQSARRRERLRLLGNAA